MECSPIKKSWGEGVKIKKNHWARGLSNIEKHGAGAKKITSGVGYILYILKSRRSGAKSLP